MADLKISQFADGGAIQTSDEIATNRAGINTKVFVGSAASLDVGSGVGDIIVWQDDGSGNPVYQAGDGSQITNIDVSSIAGLGTAALVDTGTGGGDVPLNSDLGSAAYTDSADYATAAQGALADTALQPDENVITANTGSSYNMNFANAQNFVLTMTANCTLNITNPPTEGGKVALKLIQDSTPRTPTFSMSGLAWAGGSAPTIPAGSGDYVWLVFVTANGGTSWDGFLSGTFE